METMSEWQDHTLLWEESGRTKCVCACVCGRRPLCIVVSCLPRALQTQAFACARLDTDSEAPEAQTFVISGF